MIIIVDVGEDIYETLLTYIYVVHVLIWIIKCISLNTLSDFSIFLSYMFLIDANEQNGRRLFSINSGVKIFEERDSVEIHKLFHASFEFSSSPEQVKEILEV
jgi:hypothetical protein